MPVCWQRRNCNCNSDDETSMLLGLHWASWTIAIQQVEDVFVRHIRCFNKLPERFGIPAYHQNLHIVDQIARLYRD